MAFQNRIFNFAITSDLLQETLGLAEDGNIHFNFDLDFADSEFQKIDVGSDMPYNYDAPKVRFSGKVNFEGARFSGEADFSEATFSGEANFSEATFSDIAIFWQATFSKEVNFIATTFSKEANFYNATFSDRAYFWQAKFSGKADFEGARFSGEVSFLGARFSGKADFSEARFSREANFSSAKFSNRTYFFMAAFSEKADFTVATFSGKVEFIGTTFSRKVGFVKARFSDIADFGYVVFSQKVDFTYTILLNKVRFRRATFSQDHHTYFCNLNLKQKDNPDKRNEKETYTVPSLQFRDIIFPKLVLFSNCNLSQTTFERCTIADIKFRSCEFAKTGVFIFKRNAFENRTGQKGFWKNFWFALRLEGRLLKKAFSKNQDSSLTKKRGEIKKEIKKLEKNNEKLQQKTQDKSQKLETSPLKIAKLNEKLHSIKLETEEKRKDREDLCCQMKTALESSKRWRQAGDFYIGELEARRSQNWWEYLKLSFFKYLLGYAERISVLFISITILFFAAALILGDSLYGFSFDGWFVNYNWSCFEFDFEKAAKSTIFPLTLRLELKAGDAIKFWETVFLIASWVLWITLAVAVRRRFRF